MSKLHSLTYERTDDMSVLSDFYCGIEKMDNFIHDRLQAKINGMPELESYVIREDGEGCNPRETSGYSAVPFYEKCSFIARKSHAMAVAVRMTRIIK